MQHKTKFIVVMKIFILVGIALNSMLNKSIQTGGKSPYFIYPIITSTVLLFSLLYFKLVSANYKLIPGKFNTFSSQIFINPLPFFHFVAMAALVSGIAGLLSKLLGRNEIDPFSYISLAVGIGIYIGILVANKMFVK